MLSDAVDEYLGVRRRHVKPTTLRNETFSLRRFLAYVGNIQLKNMKATHVESFFYGEGEDDLSERLGAGAFNGLLQHVRGFLAWCERRSYIRRNLLEEVRSRHVVNRERMRLSPNQLLALLEAAELPRDRALIAIAENTALRAQDIISLRVSDVNLAGRQLHTGISKSGLDVIKPISKDLDRELRRWLVYYESAQKDTFRQTLQPSWYLVPTMRLWNLNAGNEGGHHTGELYYPERRMTVPQRAVKRALDKLGLDGPGEGIHTIRRSVARAYFESLLAKGYDRALLATKEFLNHADTKTTERYLGLNHERLILEDTIAGQPFLSGMVSGENVVHMADARRTAQEGL